MQKRLQGWYLGFGTGVSCDGRVPADTVRAPRTVHAVLAFPKSDGQRELFQAPVIEDWLDWMNSPLIDGSTKLRLFAKWVRHEQHSMFRCGAIWSSGGKAQSALFGNRTLAGALVAQHSPDPVLLPSLLRLRSAAWTGTVSDKYPCAREATANAISCRTRPGGSSARNPSQVTARIHMVPTAGHLCLMSISPQSPKPSTREDILRHQRQTTRRFCLLQATCRWPRNMGGLDKKLYPRLICVLASHPDAITPPKQKLTSRRAGDLRELRLSRIVWVQDLQRQRTFLTSCDPHHRTSSVHRRVSLRFVSP